MMGGVSFESVKGDNRWAPALSLVEAWGPQHNAAAIVCTSAAGQLTATTTGPNDMIFAWASVTKLVTALTILIAVEEQTVTLSDEVSPLDGARAEDPPVTLAMLLAHAGGVHPDRPERMAAPLSRRIYSNAGIRMAALHVERAAGIGFNDYCREAVLNPLGLASTFVSDPAAGASGPLVDLIRLAGEFLQPTLITAATLADATRPYWPSLDGVLPGFGPQAPNPWGLGFEIRGSKHPHWTGSNNSTRTFGHFGQSGSMLWIDPHAAIGVCALSSDPFGPWAQKAWPGFSDAALNAGLIESSESVDHSFEFLDD
jgi:CubicO group peptidase (beta-lactamase class C family)